MSPAGGMACPGGRASLAGEGCPLCSGHLQVAAKSKEHCASRPVFPSAVTLSFGPAVSLITEGRGRAGRLRETCLVENGSAFSNTLSASQTGLKRGFLCHRTVLHASTGASFCVRPPLQPRPESRRTAFASAGDSVSIVVEPGDVVAAAAPARWAVAELEQALKAKGVAVRRQSCGHRGAADGCLHCGGRLQKCALPGCPGQRACKDAAGSRVLGIVRGTAAGREVLLACGPDARGVVYAVLELADRVNLGCGPSLRTSHRPPPSSSGRRTGCAP